MPRPSRAHAVLCLDRMSWLITRNSVSVVKAQATNASSRKLALSRADVLVARGRYKTPETFAGLTGIGAGHLLRSRRQRPFDAHLEGDRRMAPVQKMSAVSIEQVKDRLDSGQIAPLSRRRSRSPRGRLRPTDQTTRSGRRFFHLPGKRTSYDRSGRG